MILNPYQTDFVTWFDQLILDVPDTKVKLRAGPEEMWRETIEPLLQNSFYGKIGCPTTASFSNWRDWASSFIQCVGSSI